VAFDTPLDAWYVWIGVVLVSAAALGIVFELPTEQPPDAAELIETAEYVGAAGDGTAATVEVAADKLRTDGTTVELKKDDELSRKTTATVVVVPVTAADTEAGKTLLQHLLTDPTAKANYSESVIEAEIAGLVSSPATLRDEWHVLGGDVRLRAVTVEEQTVVLVG